MNCPITGSKTCRCDKQIQNNNIEKPDLKDLLRKLFTDHAVYTKFFINSSVSNLPDLSDVTTRLFENQDEIGNNLGTVVGKENGLQLAKLLREHIECAANAIGLAVKGKDLTEAKNKIFANSAKVAEFISSVNPTYLPYGKVHEHFDQHNKFVLEMTILRLNKNYKEEIITYDKYYNHILMFSDMLYTGLIHLNEIKTDVKTGGYYAKYMKYKVKYLSQKR